MGAKLKDIKGIVEVSDYSLYYLAGLTVLAVLIVGLIIYFLRKPKKRKKPTNKEIALKNLKNIDYKNTKDIAYMFTLNVPFFIDDKNREEISKLLEKLEIFKYKKEIPQMDESIKNDIKKVIKGLK